MGRDFLLIMQKVTNSGTRFLNMPNLPFSDQNLNSAGRKMYANGRYWEAKSEEGWGVARSKGKEHQFWGSERPEQLKELISFMKG